MATQATQRLLPNNRILRYTYGERIMHWISGLTYMYVMATGLAFYSPHLYWLAVLFGGGPFSRVWHPLMGLVFTASVIWMYMEWRGDMRTTAGDQAWKNTFRHYVRNEDDQVAGAGRFNYGQKQFFWVMYYAGLLLLVSGFVLWFPERIPWSLSWVRSLAVLVHVIAALFSIGAFIIHVYMGTAVVREGFSSVIRGEVSEAWAKTHHPVWLSEVRGETTAKK